LYTKATPPEREQNSVGNRVKLRYNKTLEDKIATKSWRYGVTKNTILMKGAIFIDTSILYQIILA